MSVCFYRFRPASPLILFYFLFFFFSPPYVEDVRRDNPISAFHDTYHGLFDGSSFIRSP
jgi:hypothetical protein